MTKKDRLEKYLKHKGIGPTAFARALGISNSHVSEMNARKSNRTLYLAIRSNSDFSDCNIDWIDTGEGEMLIETEKRFPKGTEKFRQFAEAINESPEGYQEEPQPVAVVLTADELELVSLYRQADKDRRRVIIDCARACADATVGRVESPGKGGGESGLAEKRSNSK